MILFIERTRDDTPGRKNGQKKRGLTVSSLTSARKAARMAVHLAARMASRTHVRTHARTFLCTCVCAHACTHVHTHVYMYACLRTCLHTCLVGTTKSTTKSSYGPKWLWPRVDMAPFWARAHACVLASLIFADRHVCRHACRHVCGRHVCVCVCACVCVNVSKNVPTPLSACLYTFPPPMPPDVHMPTLDDRFFGACRWRSSNRFLKGTSS